METDSASVNIVDVVAKCIQGVSDGNAYDAQLSCFVAGQYLAQLIGECLQPRASVVCALLHTESLPTRCLACVAHVFPCVVTLYSRDWLPVRHASLALVQWLQCC